MYSDRDSKLLGEVYKQILQESVSPEQFITYFKSRADEIADSKGYGPGHSATGSFYFELMEDNLAVMCDVIHSDTILNSIADDDFDVDQFRIEDYLPQVNDAVNEIGIKSSIGFAWNHMTVFLKTGKSLTGKSIISVNQYTPDTLTVQLELDNLSIILQKNSNGVTKIVDTFILKMFEVIKLLNTKYFPPTSFNNEL